MPSRKWAGLAITQVSLYVVTRHQVRRTGLLVIGQSWCCLTGEYLLHVLSLFRHLGPQITAPTNHPPPPSDLFPPLEGWLVTGWLLPVVGSLASVPTGPRDTTVLIVTLICEQPSRPGLETPSRDGRPPGNSEPLGVCVPILRRLQFDTAGLGRGGWCRRRQGVLQPSRISLA